jgi:hypothetical protein
MFVAISLRSLSVQRFEPAAPSRTCSERGSALSWIVELAGSAADNPTFPDIAESESLRIGTDLGIVTDIETGPGGTLFVVLLSNGVIYEISRARG